MSHAAVFAAASRPRRALWVLALVLGLGLPAAPVAAGEDVMDSESVAELKEDIAAAVLYSRLELSPAQRKVMGELLEDYHTTMSAYERARAARDATLKAELENAQRQVARTGAVDPKTQARLNELARQQSENAVQIREASRKVKGALVAQLTPDQQITLRDFRSTEALFGQAGQVSMAEDRLDDMRDMRPERVDAMAARATQRALAAGMTQAQATAQAQAYRALVEKVQAVPEESWEIEREALAHKLVKEQSLLLGESSTRQGRRGQRVGPDRLLLEEGFYDALKAGR